MANYGTTDLFGDPSQPGWEDQNLVTVTAPNGQQWRVNKASAPSFTAFLQDLSREGYSPTSSGGFNNRNIRGSDRKSQHAFGTAIDIGAAANPMGGTASDMPPDVSALAAKYGLEWGGDWTGRPDPMHFEWRGPSGPPAPPVMPVPGGVAPPMAGGYGAAVQSGGQPPQADPLKGMSPMERMLMSGGFHQDASAMPIQNIWSALTGQHQTPAEVAAMAARKQNRGPLGGLLSIFGGA